MTKLCLALEAFRRTDEGRVRDAKAFLGHFFPQDKAGATDRIFHYMPNEVRADLLSNWGIRGKKSALRDDNDRVRNTVNDALNAGDIDATVIEEGITPEILTDWVPLDDWWQFWRGSNVPIGSVRKALAVARDLLLFDERWFLDHLTLESQKLQGTDVICAALSKEQLVTWMQAIHASGDASPGGMVASLGWETILAKTAPEALLLALDALARQIGLTEPTFEARKSDVPRARSVPPPEPITPRPKSEPPPTPARRSSRPPEPESTATVTAVPPAESAPPPPPPPPHAPLPKPSVPPPKHPSAKPPVPNSTRNPEAPISKPPPVPPKPPVPTSKAPPVPKPPVPASKPPPVPASKPPARSVTPLTAELPSVIIEEDPFFAAPPPSSRVPLSPPASHPPNARALFLGAVAEPPPMRPPATTLTGVAPPAVYGLATDDVAVPTFTMPPADPSWAPPRAEPGDMGWDLAHGVTRPMGTNAVPKYNFEDDDEPTSEIELPRDMRRRQ